MVSVDMDTGRVVATLDQCISELALLKEGWKQTLQNGRNMSEQLIAII